MKSALIIAVALCLSPFAFGQAIWYVPDDFPAGIQAAINGVASGDTIIVRPGTYVEKIDFLGKAVTVMSEQGAAVTVIDGNQAGSVAVFTSGEGQDSVLDGFTLTNGKASYGGGVYCDSSSPTITNNTIAGNTAKYGGCGIYCSTSSPTISNNTITGNTSSMAAADGGGICCRSTSAPAITGNTITNNTANDNGGGICCDSTSPAITGNFISGNSAGDGGGGIFCGYSDSRIFNNTITGNTAGGMGGGGICCHDNSSPTIVNNVISENTAGSDGGGIYCGLSSPAVANNTIARNTANDNGGGVYCFISSPFIMNSIMWNNSAANEPEIHGGTGNPNVIFSNVKGGWPGMGNIDADPLFADSANNDLHLTWNSPCRNAGFNYTPLPAEDFEGDPRIRSDWVDMGADEFSHHLYKCGHAVPGNRMSIRIVGPPGAWAVLGKGAGMQDPPEPSPYGPIFIARPWTTYDLGFIPSKGVLFVQVAVPSSWVPGDEHYFQAIVSKSITLLTNPMTVTVE